MLLNARNQMLKLPTSTVGQFYLRGLTIPLLLGGGRGELEVLFRDLKTLQWIEWPFCSM